MKQGPFSGKAVAWLVGISSVSLAAALFVSVFGADLLVRRVSAGPDADSVSALGHHALVETLRRLEVPVLVSRGDSGAKAKKAGVLVVAEPEIVGDDARKRRIRLRDLVGSPVANPPLLVLPKWSGTQDPDREEWVSGAAEMPLHEVQDVLIAAGLPGTVRRADEGDLGDWDTKGIGSGVRATPTLRWPQLLAEGTPDATPVIRCAAGVLLARYDDPPVYVLSDPDLLSTHGLAKGENAVLAVALLDHLRAGGGVVLDETLHGVERRPGVWNELLRFPLSLAVVQALLAAAVLLLAATGRFGAPLRSAPAIEPGKRFLIENTAGLLRLGAHSGFALDRYLQTSVLEAARATHAPANLSRERVREWLARAGESRGAHERLEALEAEVAAVRTDSAASPERVVAAARRIHRWRVEATAGDGR